MCKTSSKAPCSHQSLVSCLSLHPWAAADPAKPAGPSQIGPSLLLSCMGSLGCPSPARSLMLPNKPRRGSPGKTKQCELACQQLNHRTSQTNIASIADSSLSWMLQVKENTGLLWGSAAGLWLTLGVLRAGGPCVVGKGGLVWYHAVDMFYEESQIQRMKVLSCPQHPARILCAAKSSMRWRCFSMDSNDKWRRFFCQLEQLLTPIT